MPEENIEVRPINTGIVLSGTLSGAVRMERALTVAEQFVGSAGEVTNLMGVMGSQQVMLSVRFTEINRSVSKRLGISNAFSGGDFGFISGSPTSTAGSGFDIDLDDPDVTTTFVGEISGFA